MFLYKGNTHKSTDVYRVRTRLFRLLGFILVVALAVFSAVYVYKKTIHPRYVEQSLGITYDKPVGEITESTTIEQTFETDQDIDGIALLMATYNRDNQSSLSLKITNLTLNQTVYNQTVPATTFSDNQHYRFTFDNDDTYEGSAKYELFITSTNAAPGNAITVWSSSDDDYARGALSVNDKVQNGDLALYTYFIDYNYQPIKIYLNRLMLIILFFAFILLHFLVDLKKMYDWIFNKRVLVVIAIILFFTINQYHFSSIGYYDRLVQPKQGSEFIEPIWGTSRGIRSDEWLVGTPQKLSAQYSDFGRFNDVLRAEHSPNLPASGLYLSYSALAKPLDWGYYLFGVEYGFAFNWISFLMLTYLFSFELCLIFSNRNRLISLMGATLITFSGYFLWWSFIGWLLSGQAALVLIYYFINSKTKLARIFCGIGTAVFGANFVVSLYPAWQVPAGLMYLGILVWMFITNWDKFKKFDKVDFALLFATLAFFASIAFAYLIEYKSYMDAIMNTVYPGKRISYGGFALDKLFYYIQVLIYPFRDIVNPSEYGVALNFYPIPTILAIYLLIKKKGKDLLTVILLAVSIPMTIYCTVGFPPIIAKALLLTYSTPERLVDILGIIQVYLLVVSLSRFEGIKKFNSFFGWTISIVSVELALYFCHKAFPTYLSTKELVVVANIFIVICALLLTDISRKFLNTLVIGIICVSLVSGLYVNPIMKGLDVLYSKPIAKEVQLLASNDPQGKWISVGSLEDSGFLVACGAPTINSVNYIPNYGLWEKLDPSGKYNEIYNRYAHIMIVLNDSATSAKLNGPDYLLLSLSYDDLKKIDVEYILSRGELKNRDNVAFNLQYTDTNLFLYKVEYK